MNASQVKSTTSNTFRSIYHDDPEFQELLEFFLSELPERKKHIIHSVDHQDLQRLERLAHQLKGAGGGYGFPDLSQLANKLEMATQADKDITAIHQHVVALTDHIDQILQNGDV